LAVTAIETRALGQLVSTIDAGFVRIHAYRLGLWGYNEERRLTLAQSESQVKQTSCVGSQGGNVHMAHGIFFRHV
jgi:hypothetical protein